MSTDDAMKQYVQKANSLIAEIGLNWNEHDIEHDCSYNEVLSKVIASTRSSFSAYTYVAFAQ